MLVEVEREALWEKKEKNRKEEKLPDGLPIPDSTPGFCLCPMRTLVNFQYFPSTC